MTYLKVESFDEFLDSLGKGVRAIAPAAHRSGGLRPEPPEEAAQPKALLTIAGARLERCDFCGCSRHACGCDAALEYEQVRDNPTLIAR